ncbi:MAG: hypothetical protein EPO01_13930 [Aquabacterium sp.]|nr:MAG: hypothetical protein EPO01_13930 [Aquabacterium sp.]
MRPPAEEIESIWAGMPRWAMAAYLALGLWVAAAPPLMLTLGGWLDWDGLDEPWSGHARLLAGVAVALAIGALMMRPAFWRNLARERRPAMRLSTLLLGLPLMTGLLWLCAWQTAEQAGALGIVATGTRRSDPGIVRQLGRDGEARDCRHSAWVSWNNGAPRRHCISSAEADELKKDMAVSRSVWNGATGTVRSTTLQPPAGLSLRAELAHTRQALNPLAVFLLIPASVAWAVWLWTLGKHRFIYLGIILAAWGGYFALPA